MSPFIKLMRLFVLMTATVLGMLVLLLVTPDLEDSMLRAVERYHRRYRANRAAVAAAVAAAAAAAKQDHDVNENQQLTTLLVKTLQFSSEDYLQIVPRTEKLLDKGRGSFTPWPHAGEEECRKLRVYFARARSLPQTALVSFPGSGNTWLRYMLETSSGLFTGSVYTDRQIISKGFYGEAVAADCGCTTVQKTHGFALLGQVPTSAGARLAEVRAFGGRAILLVRNPYEAIISYRNFLYGGHTGFAPYARFHGPEWERFARQLTPVWRELALAWSNGTKGGNGVMVVHFEKFKAKPGEELPRILDHLGLPTDPIRLRCLLRRPDGPFRRPLLSLQHRLFSSRDPFNKRLHKMIDKAIEVVDEAFRDRGWEPMPTHLYKFYKRPRGQ